MAHDSNRHSDRLPYALTGYGIPHMIGFLATKAGERHPRPMDQVALMDAAVDFGLEGVEFDLRARSQRSPGELRDALDARGLHIIADFMAILQADAETFRSYLRDAALVGAKVVRSMISNIVCGNRGSLPVGWDAHIEAVAARLREILPYAHDLGLCVALENHQDATSDDLLRLYEMTGHHPAYGVTLDAGNPLSVGEGPVEAARRLGPIIRHLHLKDYTIHFAPEGYRLVRCPAGTGVVDFPAILAIVRVCGGDVLPGIEIAAQPTRTIPMLEDSWWESFPSDHRKHLLPALRILWAKGRPVDEPYSSAWERGEGSEAVTREEWEVLCRSVDYFRSLAETPPADPG